jgi:hypothetical protein
MNIITSYLWYNIVMAGLEIYKLCIYQVDQNMKKVFLLIYLVLLCTVVVAQNETPEGQARKRINKAFEGGTVKSAESQEIKRALEFVTDLAVNRTPFLTAKELRLGRGDTAHAVYINEGGASGLFRYDRQNTSPDDSAMVIIAGKRRYVRSYDGYINVKWFGAKGDGVADDTRAIQRAIDYLNPSDHKVYQFEQSIKSGGTVYIPAGRYKITRTLILTNSVTLLGNMGPSGYSQKYQNTNTASILVGSFDQDAFMIQTQSWRNADAALKPVTPGRVKFNEGTHWRQSDGKKLTLTSGASVKNLVLVNQGSKRFGGIRFSSSTYGSIENCEIADSWIGIMMDCALFNKIENCHIDARIAGIVVSESSVSNSIRQVYLNNNAKTSFNERGMKVPPYLDMDRYNSIKTDLGYNSAKKSIGIFIHGANGIQLDNIVFEGWDIGLVNKLGKVNASLLYFEHIDDTAIICSRGTTVISTVEFVSTKFWYGIDDFVQLTVLQSSSSHEPKGGGKFKAGFDRLKPGTNVIRLKDDYLTQRDLRTEERYISQPNLIDSLKNNSIVQVAESAKAPEKGNIFTFGGAANSQSQSQLFVSGNESNPGVWVRARENGGKYAPWTRSFSESGGSFTGDVFFNGVVGKNGFVSGTGDGASYDKYNFALRGHFGMALSDFNNKVNGFYNFRKGAWDVKDGYYINGVSLKAKASGDIANKVGATYSQKEVQAILDELRDLKQKMRESNLLN